MSRQYFIKSLLICTVFLFLAPVAASSGEKEKSRILKPIVITSSTLSADNKANTALFEGSVVAKSDAMTLYSDKMNVSYAADGTITKIIADGNVKLVKDSQAIISGSAEYLSEKENITFTDNPKAIKGSNIVMGSKITYYIESDRSVVENSKVFLKQTTGGSSEE